MASAFRETWAALERRIGQLVSLPISDLDPPSLKRRLTEIGQA
jgi:hypothetical protein